MPSKYANLSLGELEEKLKKLEKTVTTVAQEEPFWMYKPSNGLVSKERSAFLAEYLKPEDIPQGKLDCQLDMHLSRANITLISGGNQGGKTSSATVEGIIWSTGALPFSLEKIYPKSKLPTQWPVYGRVSCVDNHSLAMVILKAWQKWVPRKFLLEGDWSKSYSAEHKILTLYSPDRREIAAVEFKTNEQKTKSFQGNPLQWAIFDEQPDKDKYEETKARFATAAHGLRVLFSMTPTEGMTWVKEDILDAEDGKYILCFKMPSICNEYTHLDTLRDIYTGLDYDAVLMRLLGSFVSLSGLIYGNLYSDSTHLIEPFEVDDSFIVYRGLDPHLVKASACTEVAVDRENIQYVVGCYQAKVDTEQFKADLAERARARNYRLGWARCDKSADSNIKLFGDLNAFWELRKAPNAVQALDVSEKYAGSILAGVDQIKRLLKVNPATGQPGMKILDIPETLPLRKAFKNMERDSYVNEDKKGAKDAILEGKFDNHACLRYINQRIVGWLPKMEAPPEYQKGRYY